MTLSVKAVSKKIGNFQLGPLDLTVENGVTVLLGPNGAGKTTLLNIIAGIVKPDSGGVFSDGEEITHLPPNLRRIGYVFQNLYLFPHMTVKENIQYGIDTKEPPNKESHVNRIMDMLALRHLVERGADNLSGGEARRVTLARTLVTEPRVLLLDEPFHSLDYSIKSTFQKQLRQLLSELNIPTIFVTHQAEEMLSVADRLAVMEEGRIVAEGEVDTVFSKPITPYLAAAAGYENLFEGKGDQG